MTDETRKISRLHRRPLDRRPPSIFMRSLPPAPSADWLDFAVFCRLGGALREVVRRHRQESGMSLSFTVHFAAAVLFGPAFAMRGRGLSAW